MQLQAQHYGNLQQAMEMSSGEDMHALRQLLLRGRDPNLRWRRYALRRR
jgi:hypothetical protein